MSNRRNEIRIAVISVLVWTSTAVVVTAFVVRSSHRSVDELSLNQSRTLFQTIVDFRAWNASHGGVYVPVSDETPPNPYIELERRDVVTEDGQHLTLVNPAYMTRQFAELSRHQEGIVVHITSRNPIRPANLANEWERQALAGFESGEREWWRYDVDEQSRPVFRYMAPLITEAACLPCHAQQGYAIGDIRGGISITEPADLFLVAKADNLRTATLTAVVVWLMGLALIGIVARTFRQRRQALDRAHELTLVDSLTSIYNRRGFMTLAEKSLQSVARRHSRATVLFIDLDNFKSVNDQYGHEEGDIALRRVADMLQATFRASDIIGRLGGDEFVVLLPDASKRAGESARDRLWDAMRYENERANTDYELSVSVGMVEYDPESPKGLDELMRIADSEMYSMKRHKSADYDSASRSAPPHPPLREH